ncbi:hypothetical protein EV122DRAFT_182835, partial [Schizophyllum commune]
ERFDFTEVAPWLDPYAPSPRKRYVYGWGHRAWGSEGAIPIAVEPYAEDLRAALADVDRDFGVMRNTRAQITNLLRGVDALMSDMKQVAIRCRSRLAPIHKLPPDLLALIFRWSTAGRDALLTYAILPGLLMHVCRRWRVVAQNEPRLWTRTDATENLPKGSPRSYLSKDADRILGTYLCYSQTLPISVRFAGISHAHNQSISYGIMYMLTQGHCRTRIRELRLESGDGGMSWFALQAAQGAPSYFPTLRHLDLSGWPPGYFGDVMSIFDATALRTSMLPKSFGSLSGALRQSLKHITTYTGPMVVAGLNILQEMSNLEICTIRFPDSDWSHLTEIRPLESSL